MASEVLSFVLRVVLVACVWAFTWQVVEPRTQGLRIVRAALLVVGLLVVFGALRVAGI